MFVTVPVVIVGFAVLAPFLGFVLTGAVVLAGLSILLGGRPGVSIAVTVIAVPLIYQLFTGLLRVPLPHGVLGW